MDTISDRIIYGAMQIGGDWKTKKISPDEMSKGCKALEAAYDIGITEYDHANIYTHGKSETVFGEFVKANAIPRDNLFIQTKVGIILDAVIGSAIYDFSKEHVLSEVPKSLKRLGVDYVDRLLLHRPDPLFDPDGLRDAIDALFEEGLIRDIGVSNMSAEYITLMENVLEREMAANQVELSLGHTDFVDTVVDFNTARYSNLKIDGTVAYCMSCGIELQAWSPLFRGYLSGRDISGCSESIQNTASVVDRMATEKDTSTESIVLAWLLKHPARIKPVVGTTNPERIRNIVDCTEVELSKLEWYELYVTSRGKEMP